MSKLSDLHIEQQESGESHSPTVRLSRAKEEYSKAKVEWYVNEFLKVGEKRSLAELATGIIDCETTMSHTQFLGIFDDVLKYKLSKLNKERGRS
jgi:hypothetical protein